MTPSSNTDPAPGGPFRPIAFVRSASRYRFEAPRQAVYASAGAFIEFAGDPRLPLAAADLAGFDRIWLIGLFSLNRAAAWKPKVRPPLSPDGRRYGVLATRSPHRPNPIALSAVRLLAVEKAGLRVGPCDLLDGTPILDIKPYIPEADSFPDSKTGWRSSLPAPWRVTLAPAAAAKSAWIEARTGLDLANFCRIQLGSNPLDARRKRITPLDPARRLYAIGCRTWRADFTLDEPARAAAVLDIASHYSPADLLPGSPDPYADKPVHRAFLETFPPPRF